MLGITLVILAFGLVMIYSSSYYYALDTYKNKTFFFDSNLKWGILGVLLMLAISFVPYRWIKKMALPLLTVSFILLMIVLLFSEAKRGANRWIEFKGISFQPVEVAKISLIVFWGWYISRLHDKHKNINQIKYLAPLGVILVVFFLMVYMQPNLSSATIMVLAPIIALFVAGLSVGWMVIITSASFLVGYLILIVKSFGSERIASFLNPIAHMKGNAWQITHGLFAMGTGRVFGVGLGLSTQNKLYIPDPQNDFILSTLGEELGWLGTVGLLLLYILFIYRCITIAMSAPDVFSLVFATGFTAMITIQVVMNYAVTTAMIPVTGVSLPLVSHGGSSLIIILSSIGIMLNISRHRKGRSE